MTVQPSLYGSGEPGAGDDTCRLRKGFCPGAGVNG
jgi:hypothetical protein